MRGVILFALGGIGLGLGVGSACKSGGTQAKPTGTSEVADLFGSPAGDGGAFTGFGGSTDASRGPNLFSPDAAPLSPPRSPFAPADGGLVR